MQLTRKDRWMLANQYRILEALYPDDADAYREHREALESGYEAHYERAIPHIADGPDVMTEEESSEVTDTFRVYDAMQQAQRDLGADSGIAAADVLLPGWDGNNEAKQLGYARFYIRPGSSRYEHLAVGRDSCNSHVPMRGRYRSMVERWRGWGEPFTLRADQVRELIDLSFHGGA